MPLLGKVAYDVIELVYGPSKARVIKKVETFLY